MKVNHVIHIHDEDIVGTIQDFLYALWEHCRLNAVLAPLENESRLSVDIQVIEETKVIRKVNPFIPYMPINAASEVASFMSEHAGKRNAVILRACELRTLVELRKRQHLRTVRSASEGTDDGLIIIGVDCPGTFSKSVYSGMVQKYSFDYVLKSILNPGSSNIPIHNGFRNACQRCDSPTPIGAHITIGTLGVVPKQVLLVIVSNEETDARLGMVSLTDRLATEDEVAQRENMIDTVLIQRSDLLKNSPAGSWQHQDGFTTLLANLARCTLCGDCIDACPLYNGELINFLGTGDPSERGHSFLSDIVNITRWLASCSGCGMCQEACEDGIPLAYLLSTLGRSIRNELHYKAGDPSEQLPWKRMDPIVRLELLEAAYDLPT